MRYIRIRLSFIILPFCIILLSLVALSMSLSKIRVCSYMFFFTISYHFSHIVCFQSPMLRTSIAFPFGFLPFTSLIFQYVTMMRKGSVISVVMNVSNVGHERKNWCNHPAYVVPKSITEIIKHNLWLVV